MGHTVQEPGEQGMRVTWTTPQQGRPAWTPPPRPGIVPLHPLTFGAVLGRSFTALRQNPRVLLGFALLVQVAAYIVVGAATAGVAFGVFSRLDTVTPGSDDYNAIMAGSFAITVLVAGILGLAAGVLGVIVQAVVVTEVAHEVLAEKLTLKALWRRVRPVAWRLIGYAAILGAAVLLGVGAVVLAISGLALLTPIAAVLAAILSVLGGIVLSLWLSTKLLLTPAAIILERATIRGGIARSWRLTRSRFWPILGVTIVIQLIFQVLAQIISIPFSLLGSTLSTIIAPTGADATTVPLSFIITVVAVQCLALVISAISTVVLSTATALLYVDCRMRHEGLDLDLLSYVEQRDAGAPGLADPYTVGIGRIAAPRHPAPAYAGQPGYGYPPQAYPALGYPAPGYAAPPAAYPAAPVPGGAPGAPAAAPAPAPDVAPAPTQWTAPGERPDDPSTP
ncbi:hypothetical protein [Microbacterium candidum]|uniref:DUF7847 domain-containing protein n=1 Tax=Microbacterium candidum TaxID=3041922 RepID=A0ABT7N0X0_9MICO|nr:hypothetical protein [Microbacterium sp. ASV49]MDL9980354.1 hypothetical protein [Microbacterium sp. ASV49]